MSTVNVLGTLLFDPIDSGLTRLQFTVYLDAVAESGRNPVSLSARFILCVGGTRRRNLSEGKNSFFLVS